MKYHYAWLVYQLTCYKTDVYMKSLLNVKKARITVIRASPPLAQL